MHSGSPPGFLISATAKDGIRRWQRVWHQKHGSAPRQCPWPRTFQSFDSWFVKPSFTELCASKRFLCKNHLQSGILYQQERNAQSPFTDCLPDSCLMEVQPFHPAGY